VGDKIKLYLPSWVVSGTAAPTKTGCGGSTFTTTTSDSGDAINAHVVFIVGTATLTANTACTITTAATLPNTATARSQAAVQNPFLPSIAATLTGATDTLVTTIETSTDTVDGAITATSLVFSNQNAGQASSFTATFLVNNNLEVNDKFKVYLPFFTLVTGNAPTTQGCGTSTFTATKDDSSSTNAHVTFLVRSATLTAGTACTITSNSQVTASKGTAAVLRDAVAYKFAATIASGTNQNIGKTNIIYFNPIVLPHFYVSVVDFTNPCTTAAAAAVTFSFKSFSALAQGDTIAVKLPSQTITNDLAAPTASCGGSTFAYSSNGNSGNGAAAIKFTVASATLAANTACTITTATGAIRTTAASAVDQASGIELTGTIADSADTAANAVVTSNQVGVYPGYSKLAISYPIAGTPVAPSAVTFSFIAHQNLVQGNKIVVVLPSWTLTAGHAPTTAPGTCGTSTFTYGVAASTDAGAAITFTVATATLTAGTTCSIITSSSSTSVGSTAQGANWDSYTVQVTGGSPIAATPIPTSTQTARAAFSASSLTIATAYAGAASTIAFAFSCTAALAVNDEITLKLPTWTLAGTAAPATSGCGTSSFTTAVLHTGQNDASLVFTVATAALVAETACTITTTSATTKVAAAAQIVDDTVRTMAAKIAATNDVLAISITTSTATPRAAFFDTKLTIANPYTATAGSVSVAFKISVPVAVGDTISVTLPQWTLTGTAAPTTAGCGTSTFTTAVANSEQNDAALVFTVATSTLAANNGATDTACTIITADATAKTAVAEQGSNFATRTIGATLASMSNPVTIGIAESPKTTDARFEVSSTESAILTITNPYIGKATATPYASYVGKTSALVLSFKCNKALAVNDKVIIALPYFSVSAGVTTKQGCGTSTFQQTVSNTNTVDAAVTFTVGTTTLAASTACTITTSSQTVTVYTVAQAANLATRTIEASIASLAAEATPSPRAITTSTATSLLSFGASAMTIAPTKDIHGYDEVLSNTAYKVSFSFQANFPITDCDTITATIPGFNFNTSAPDMSTLNSESFCGTSIFTAKLSGSATDHAEVVFTSGGPVAANTSCTLTIFNAISTGVAQAANLESRTLSYQSQVGGIFGAQTGTNAAGLNSFAMSAITTSSAVTDPTGHTHSSHRTLNLTIACIIGGVVGLLIMTCLLWNLFCTGSTGSAEAAPVTPVSKAVV